MVRSERVNLQLYVSISSYLRKGNMPYVVGSFRYLSPCRVYCRLRMAKRSLTIFNCSAGSMVSRAAEVKMVISFSIDGPSFIMQLLRNPRHRVPQLSLCSGLRENPLRIVSQLLIGVVPR